jgi:hypothetical protein
MDDKKIQAKLIGAAIVKIIPQAAPVAYEWAERMYDGGVRCHPELIGADSPKMPVMAPTPAQTEDAVRARAFAVLREMADRFPQFRPLVNTIESASSPEERAEALLRLQGQIDPQMLAMAKARAGLVDDDTE